MASRISNSKADETYDLSHFIATAPTDETTYYNYSILNYLNGFEYSIINILYDYEDELTSYAKTVLLSDDQFLKYRYKPGLLAYDVYGAVEPEFIIKMLNGFLSDREFDFKRVKLIPSSELGSILGRIYSANSQFINNNRSDLKEEEKKDMQGNTVW